MDSYNTQDASTAKHISHILTSMAQALCQSGLLGICYGSISARLSMSSFLINRHNAILHHCDARSFITLLDTQDYRWQDASLDHFIHAHIYRNFLEARFIIYSHAPYATSYSLQHDVLIPIDYLGRSIFERCEIVDTKEYETLNERADVDIVRYFKAHKKHALILKGCGIYGYGRDLYALANLIYAIENSCKILHFKEALLANTSLIKPNIT